MRITYNQEVDVLYISLVPPTGRVASVENANGDLLRIDTLTDKIIGVTIQLFMHRVRLGEKIEVPEINFSISASDAENLLSKANAR
ncbi:MAG: DUF2283 domain-containing protein [Terracidiphilus sp.]